MKLQLPGNIEAIPTTTNIQNRPSPIAHRLFLAAKAPPLPLPPFPPLPLPIISPYLTIMKLFSSRVVSNRG